MANPVKRLANALDDENAIVAVLERGDMSLHRCISVQSRSIIVMPVEGASITSMILSRALATTPLPSDMRIDLQARARRWAGGELAKVPDRVTALQLLHFPLASATPHVGHSALTYNHVFAQPSCI